MVVQNPLMHPYVLVMAAAVLTATTGCANAPERMYLSCQLADRTNQTYQYSFEFDPDTGYLFWVEGTERLKVLRNTPTQLWGQYTENYEPFRYDHATFQLNRVTGRTEIFYSRKPMAEEIRKCKEAREWAATRTLFLASTLKLDIVIGENGSFRVEFRIS